MSIVLKNLKFSNMYSYGQNIEVSLNKEKITQLSAPNGAGKSSIALILQEILYNKNIKGIKKGDILNKYITDKDWYATLTFSVNNDEYLIDVRRTPTQTKVVLFENDIDISEHKVLDTYKKLHEILGMQFDIFSQLTYQSSIDLLDFLKATDSNRKKFLINLFNFTKYLELGDVIKLESNKIDKELIARRGELKSVEEYINNSSILPNKELIDVPEVDEQIKYSIKELELKIHNIDADIKQIDKNNLYIRERNDINFSVSMQIPTNPQLDSAIQKTRDSVNLSKRLIQEAKDKLKTLDLSDSCYACGQSLDNSQSLSLKNNFEEAIDINSKSYAEHEAEYKNLTKQQKDYEIALTAYNANKVSIERFETLSNLIDSSLPKNTPDKQQIDLELVKLKNSLKSQDDERNKIKRYNEDVTSHNTKMVILKEELQKFSSRQTELNSDIFNLQGKYDNLQILKKAFSTSGIVAYKLENVAKDLENTINRYLTVLSDGQFSVVFRLIGEKLNVVIVSNGKEVTIESLSGGEFSRVQTSVLLAVRSTLSKIGGNSINLLFLDEITGVLDDAGKEKLFEILSEEVGLNVFLISHDYSHPLIPKIEIEKENNISTMC
jgi:DNA repair exonuclease SbcCD ATPase subunit